MFNEMTTLLTPLESLHEPKAEHGVNFPLPVELSRLYGNLQFPPHVGRPYVIANSISTLDGVVSLGLPGRSDGEEISEFDLHGRMVMGLLRAVADVIIVDAGTLRAVSADHLWSAAYIFPALAEAYQELRSAMGKIGPPLTVIVTDHAEIDLSLRVFQSGEVPVLIVTTAQGQQHLLNRHVPPSVQITVAERTADGQLSAQAVLDTCVGHLYQSDVILVEGGPYLLGNFFNEKCLDEFFLTFSPQIAGRDNLPALAVLAQATEQSGFINGKRFASEQLLWGALAGVKRAGSHLFLRYVINESAAEKRKHYVANR